MRFQTLVLWVILGMVFFSSPVGATRTRTFRSDSYEAFRTTDLKGIGISEQGLVFLGPAETRLSDPGVRTIWALVRTEHGLACATGDQGRVFVWTGQKEEAEPKPLASLFDYELFALAADTKGNLYAAGAPNGTVVRVASDGGTHTLFDVPEGVIFSLLAAPDGTVYAATGDRGRLYRIAPSGEGKVLSESADLSLRCLAWSSDGKTIVAGTDGRGLVEEIDPQLGSTRVIYDAAEEEIVAIVALPDGGLVFGANPGVAGGSAPAEGGEGGGHGGSSHSGRSTDATGSGTEPPKSVVYRMSAKGSVRVLWQCPEKMIHALALEADGSVLVATGDDAAVYRVSPLDRATLLWRAAEEQVLSIQVSNGIIYAGTGSPGRLYRLGAEASESGQITSKVLDGHDLARWGALQWDGAAGSGTIDFETRSGFTDPPDPSWSGWAPAQPNAQGLTVASPPARYLQWRARLDRNGADLPSFRRVQIAYGGVNDRPSISGLRVSPDEPLYTAGESGRGTSLTQLLPGGVQIDYSLPPSATGIVAVDEVPTWVRRIRSITWEVQDPDGDDLSFDLGIRKLGETKFLSLARDIRDHGWSFDAGTIPDGVYEVQLTASDAPSNPPGEELSDERLTPPFHVDTVAPLLQEVKARLIEGGVIEITGVAVDESSPLRRVDASVDGQEFQWMSSADGLMDSPREAFSGHVPLGEGEDGSWVVIRALDAAGNRGAYRTWREK
jgi:hypothetical protein